MSDQGHGSKLLRNFWMRFDLPKDRRYTRLAVIAASAVLLCLIAARLYYTAVTGYILPDEAFYYNLFIVEGLGFSVYRPVLHLAYEIFYFGVGNSLTSYVLRGAIFCGVWAVGCILVIAKILKALDISDKASAFVVLSFLVLPVFPLMSVFTVTETMALFFALAGMLYSIRYVQEGGVRNAALAAAMLLFASQVREPYLLLLVGAPPMMFALRHSLKPFFAYAAVGIIGLPIPTSFQPLSLSQPVSNLLFEFIPNYILGFISSFRIYHVSAGAGVAAGAAGASGAAGAAAGSAGAAGAAAGAGAGAGAAAAGSFFGYTFQYVPSTVAGAGPGAATIPAYVTAASNSVSLTLGWPEFYAFLVGAFYGIRPIFLILVFLSLILALRTRSRKGVIVCWFGLLAIVGYFVTASFAVEFLPNAVSSWASNLIRLSSAALPAAICLGYLYKRLGTGASLAMFVGTLVFGLLLLSSFTSAIQSSQNIQGGTVDRLSFGYRAPYLRMAQLATPGSLVVVGPGQPQLETMLSLSDGAKTVVIQPIPASAADLARLLASRQWSHVYFYDDWVSIQNPAFIAQCQCYPTYYADIVLSHSNSTYSVTPVWVDGESYALELVN